MKVYSRVVIDMTSMEVVEEHSFEYQGEVALCGGSGASGEIKFPDYMEEIHAQWLTGGTVANPNPSITQSVEDTMNSALANLGNPYSTGFGDPEIRVFDPRDSLAPTSGSPLADMQDEHDSAETLIDAIDVAGESGTYNDIITRAAVDVNANLVSETEIDNTVTAFENNQILRHLRAVGRFSASMADRGAGDTSQFVIGMAMLESDLADNVDQFEANLRIQIKRDKQSLIDAAVKEMIMILQLQVGSSLNLVGLQGDVNKAEMISVKEHVDRVLEVDVRFALWDMEIFQMGANLIAAVSGHGHPNVEGLNKAQSALGGAASGAAIGTAAAPGIGTAIGAGIGGLFGFLSG